MQAQTPEIDALRARAEAGDGDDSGGVRHAGLSAHADVMSDPILLLNGGSM